MNEQIPQKPPHNYGSRFPVWFWVVVYMVAAFIVYGIVYFVFIRGDASFSY